MMTNNVILTTTAHTQMTTSTAINESLFDDFIAFLDVGSPKTVETYRRELQQFFNYLHINGITQPQRADVIAFRETLKQSLKPTTVQNYLTAVKLFFKWTAQQGLYPNVANHVKGEKVDREHKKDYLTASQVKDVLSGIDTDTVQGRRDYAIISLMVTCGLRDIEISRACVEDLRVSGENMVLYIQGKGHHEKADYVKISPIVEKSIRASLADREAVKDDDPLFISLSNNSKGRSLSVQTISSTVKKYLKKAGLNSKRITAHSLRHTAVTLARLAGKDITEVQQFARHKNIATTLIYDHALDRAKNTCSQAVADAIF